MTKTRFRAIRLPEPLDNRIVEEAEVRGMNWSEYVRFALTRLLFFDPSDDNGHQNGVAKPCANHETHA